MVDLDLLISLDEVFDVLLFFFSSLIWEGGGVNGVKRSTSPTPSTHIESTRVKLTQCSNIDEQKSMNSWHKYIY